MKKGQKIISGSWKYALEDRIDKGNGSFGRVYECTRDMVDCVTEIYGDYDEIYEAVIKFLKPDLVSKISVLKRFRNEAEKMLELRHPNIIDVYDCVTDVGNLPEGVDSPFYVMELMESSIEDRLASGTPLDLACAVKIILQAGAGLQYAYANGVKAHGDISDANILLDSGGNAKLCDFGMMMIDKRLAKKMRSVMSRTTPDTWNRKLRTFSEFAAPEVKTGGFTEVSEKSDVYSLGVVLDKLLEVCPDFKGREDILNVVEAATRRTSSRRPSLSDFLEGVSGASGIKFFEGYHEVESIDVLLEGVEIGESGNKVLKNSEGDRFFEKRQDRELGNLILLHLDSANTLKLRKVDGYAVISNGVHYVTEDIIVPEGSTLEIMPGAELRFGRRGGVVVKGTLKAEGNEENQIVFTNAYADLDEYNVELGPPRVDIDKYHWNNILLDGKNSAGSVLKHCIIEYGCGRTTKSLFSDNEDTTRVGGGLIIRHSLPVLEDCEIRYCSAGVGGGMLLLSVKEKEVSTRKVLDLLVHENKSTKGGGIAVINSKNIIFETKQPDRYPNTYELFRICTNHAKEGAGAYVVNSQNILFDGVVIRNNSGAYNGGGIYLNNSSMSILGCDLLSGSARDKGGFIYGLDDCVILIKQSKIENCMTQGIGAAICTKDCDIKLVDSAIKNCKSEGGGGAVYILGGSFDIYGPDIISTFPKDVISEDQD